MDLEEDPFLQGASQSTLLSCTFNQDGGCLAIGTTTGFSVHDIHPHYGVSIKRELQGGIGQVELLFRCNLMALVGGGPSPHAPPHRVVIWDDHIPKEAGELSFRQTALRVKLRKDAIAVALRDRVYVYHLTDLSLRDKIYTSDNPHGLLCVSTQIQDMVLACPSVTPGHVRVELYGLRKTVLLEAHSGELRALALTADGSKLVTASVKGTVLRIWDVASSSCLQEFRRGVERTTITCLAWSWDNRWLSCTSDRGTAHVFQVGVERQVDTSLTQMLLSTVRKSVEGDTTKSICQIRGVPHPQACAFIADSPNLIAVAGWDADGNGVLLISEFSVDEEPKRVGYHVLCRSAMQDPSEEARRRRRLRGWTPSVPQTPEGGRLYVGERLEVLEKGMEAIQFEEDDEFISVLPIVTREDNPVIEEESPSLIKTQAQTLTSTPEAPEHATTSNESAGDEATAEDANADSETGGDSLQTEPLNEISDIKEEDYGDY